MPLSGPLHVSKSELGQTEKKQGYTGTSGIVLGLQTWLVLRNVLINMTMIRPLLLLLCFCTTGLAQKGHPADMNTLKIGDTAPPFSLKGVDGKIWTLNKFADSKFLVVLFTCNHCPSAQALESRFKAFVETYRPKGVGVVAISPNSPKGLRPDELGYSLYGDSYEDMVNHAREQEFNFPYLYDGDEQLIARAYGCLATPHVFIFDAARTLQYKGRFDNSRYADPKTVKTHDAIDAMDALLAGDPVAVTETRPHGCSTKWAFKADVVAEHAAKLDNSPVSVDVLDIDGMKELLKPNGRFRMVNLWATWCAPCVAEFPELVAISRKFGLRDFEFTSISFDRPATVKRVQGFLEKQGAAPERKLAAALKKEGRTTPHVLFNGDQDELAALLDPKWPGPLPYTVLIDEKGTIVARYSGRIDAHKVTETIINHLGKYFVP